MKQRLDTQSVAILKTRVHVGRLMRLFTFEKLAKEWGISEQTLYRYISPDYRELSRRAAEKATEKYKKGDHTKCFKCHKSLKNHHRCPYCTILIHTLPCDCEERLSIIQSGAFDIHLT